jgi:hypothetical protein
MRKNKISSFFFKGFIELAESLDLEYDPEFIMQDA